MEAIDPKYGTTVLLLIAAAAVALLLVLIIVVKLHAFISLVLVSVVTAVAVGFPLGDIPDVLMFGFADTLGVGGTARRLRGDARATSRGDRRRPGAR